jgi:hypothetical protein
MYCDGCCVQDIMMIRRNILVDLLASDVNEAIQLLPERIRELLSQIKGRKKREVVFHFPAQ